MHLMTSPRIDYRFIVGIGVVAGSAALGALALSSQHNTQAVYVAATTLSPGKTLTESDLRLANVNLADSIENYLHSGDLAPGTVVSATIKQGEFVPVSSLGSKQQSNTSRVVVTVTAPLSSDVASGEKVDVWASMAAGQGLYAPPEVLVSKATVVKVTENTAVGIGGSSFDVELIVPSTSVASVLEASANGDHMALLLSSMGTR